VERLTICRKLSCKACWYMSYFSADKISPCSLSLLNCSQMISTSMVTSIDYSVFCSLCGKVFYSSSYFHLLTVGSSQVLNFLALIQNETWFYKNGETISSENGSHRGVRFSFLCLSCTQGIYTNSIGYPCLRKYLE
jgi:hypothetical protein